MDNPSGNGGTGRRPTSVDVAREAGLSRTTVSFVLNDTPHQKIPEETRRKVIEAANRLGYTPFPAARALRSGRSDIVLCILPDIPIGHAVGAFLDRLSALFEAAGFTFLAHPRAHNVRPVSQVWKAITPAAVVSFDQFSDEDLATMKAAGIEVTVTAFGSTDHAAEVLNYSDERVGRLQVEHLAAAGHRRLGYAYPDDTRMAYFADPRLDGARAACLERDLDALVPVKMELSIAGAIDAVRTWTTATPPVTGVCAYNDDVALAVLAGMRELGLTAPTDLAVIGMDDTPAAAFAAPPLTTINSDIAGLARHVADTVLNRLADQSPSPDTTPGTITVITRETA